MTYNSAYPILKLFIKKAKKLEDSSFFDSITSEVRLGLKMEKGKKLEVTSIRPQQESIDAFVLTFRFFIQDNETISLRNLQKIFKSNLVTKKEREKYNSLRSELKNFLAESANVVILEDKPTNLDVMETVLFGELSHSNIEKQKRFEYWMDNSSLMTEWIWHRFIISIMFVVSIIQHVKCLLCRIINRNLAVNINIVVKNYGVVQLSYVIYNGCSVN